MSILHRRRRVKRRLREWEAEGEIVSYDAQLRTEAQSAAPSAPRAKPKARKKAKRRVAK